VSCEIAVGVSKVRLNVAGWDGHDSSLKGDPGSIEPLDHTDELVCELLCLHLANRLLNRFLDHLAQAQALLLRLLLSPLVAREPLASDGLGVLRAGARFLAREANTVPLGVAPKAAGSGQGMALAALWDLGGVVVRGHAASPVGAVLAAFRLR